MRLSYMTLPHSVNERRVVPLVLPSCLSPANNNNKKSRLFHFFVFPDISKDALCSIAWDRDDGLFHLPKLMSAWVESACPFNQKKSVFFFLSFYWFWRMASSICWQSQLNSRCHGSAKGTSRGTGVLWVRPCVVLLPSHSSQPPKTQNFFLPIGSAHLVWYCPDSIYLPTVVMSSLFERIKSAIPSDGLQIASYKVIRNVQVYWYNHIDLYF